MLETTFHGAGRHQNRSTLPMVKSLVFDFGTRVRAKGADIVFLDRAARKRIRREVGGDRGMRVLENYLKNAYLVVADNGRIITTGWRTRRVRRP